MSLQDKKHTTEQEIKFINSLGEHSEQHNLTEKQLLENYIGAIDKRTDWGQIDAQEIKKAAIARLKQLISEQKAA